MDDFYVLKFHESYEHVPKKNVFFEIPPRAKPFSDPLTYFIKWRILDQNDKFSHKNDKFSNKNDLLCAWRDFKKILYDVCTYVHMIYENSSQTFHPYSILSG